MERLLMQDLIGGAMKKGTSFPIRKFGLLIQDLYYWTAEDSDKYEWD